MTFQPPYRPSGRSVWLGRDLVETDDWIVRLSPATLEEIDAAVRRLRGRNAYDAPVRREEFPLATMADDLARMRQEIATGRGFFVFRGLDRDRYCDKSSASSSADSAPISATSSRKARSATAWAISATSAIFWSSVASGAVISQAASRPRTPTRAGRSASSPCSA